MAAVKGRPDGRRPDQLRPVRISRHYLKHAEGSCLIEVGDTRVLCAASIETGVPAWMDGGDRGWVTAEYAMLPRATHTRSPRDGRGNRPVARSLEIQRLVARSLRGVTDLPAVGERRVIVDCDVVQADGGTRAAAITGGYVALYDAFLKLGIADARGRPPMKEAISGISAGIVDNQPLLDLCYEEDSRAEVDLNCAVTASGRLVEIQGTGEGRPFTAAEFNALLELARGGAALLNRLVTQLFERDLPAIRTHEGT